jgi:hypothetical protein
MSERLFTSWVRRGAAAGITEADPASGGWSGPATFQPSLVLTRDGAPQPAVPGPQLPLLGPGAVTGLNPKAVARTDPAAGATGVEDNYLVQIEFSRADLPWMFSPAMPNAANRLRPWLVLIVVDASAVQLQPGTPLPRISVHDSDLPNLDDSWGWAHAQVTVDNLANAAAELTPASGTSAISRLLCPRKLQPDTAYLACVVPATLPGVQAGLGLPLSAGPAIAQAWNAGSGNDVVLPVYYSWSFSTGDDGDFKSLVGRLRGVRPTDLSGFGTRTVDMSSPWQAGAQLPAGTTVGLGGALGMGIDAPLPDAIQGTFEDRMTTLLDFPSQLQPATATADPTLTAVAPPIYGGRHAGVTSLDPPAPEAPVPVGWLQTLNLDPRRRIAAAFGTRYVQENQEFLMDQAWSQLGAVQEANRLQALAELASQVGDRMHQRHIAPLGQTPLGPSPMISITAPARTRLLPAGRTQTLAAITDATPVPDGAATVAFRRFTRPLGPVGKRVYNIVPANAAQIDAADGQQPVFQQSSVLASGLTGSLTIPPPLEDGLGQLAQAPPAPTAQDPTAWLVSRGWQAIATIEQAIPPPGPVSLLIPVINSKLAGNNVKPKQALAPQALAPGTPVRRVFSPPRVQITTQAVSILITLVTQGLQPSIGILKRFQARVQVPPGLAPKGPVMAGPQFTAPIAMALMNGHTDWLLPGLGNFPDNRVSLLKSDPAFVEAFLAGANHEMNRELLWREYPTDQRGTPFRYFWPRPDRNPDIPPITNWLLTTPLGGNGLQNGVDQASMIVLLVRGELLHRYPRMIVHAVPGMFEADGVTVTLNAAGAWTPPQFALRLDERTTAFAYPLDQATISGKPGYYFVFSEPMTGPRFNFDEPSASPPQQWTDLDWSRVPQSRGFAIAGASLATPPDEASTAVWNKDAADIARVAFARPYRVGFHADELLAVPA